jgi:UDP-N-acetyl-L-fucosamine synthase
MLNIKKLKVLTVVGTRPEIIRLSRVIAKLDESEPVEHILVHTGQNYDYELNQIFFEDLELRKPDYFLNVDTGSLGKSVGEIISKSEDIFRKEMPDALLVLGDTNSCLSAYMAKRLHIPVFHMEAGNRCFDERVPEETNRRIVDHIADVNLTYSSIAREYLLREGLQPDRVIKTGSPMFEVLTYFKDKIESSKAVEKHSVVPFKYFLISSHREENIASKKYKYFVQLLNNLAEEYKLPIIVSTHPRTKKEIDKNGSIFSGLIKFMKPMGFHEYNNLQINAKAVLSDSGTIAEESSILNFPALNIREAHERPEAMEEAAVMMTGYNSDRIMQALKILETQKRGDKRSLKLVADYSISNVSEKVIRVIISYVDYIKSNVWKENIY